MYKLRVVSLIVVIVLTFFLFSCTTKPSEERVRAEVENKFEHTWPGIIKIVSFEKTNGEGDSREYRLYYKCKCEILRNTDGFSTKDKSSHIGNLENIKWIKTRYPTPKTPYERFVKISKGDIFEFSSYRKYRKTEKGWV